MPYTSQPNSPEREYTPPPFIPRLFEGSTEKGCSDPDAQGLEHAPDLDACTALWDKYSMPGNIRDHSMQVALIVATLGAMALEKGASLSRPVILAGALLHDIAKIYTIQHGGDHAQLGAAIARRETRNYCIAGMVYHHVHWPWQIDVFNDRMLAPLLLVYADKRVMHDRIVNIEERFEDLIKRYGRTEHSRAMLLLSKEQGIQIEKALSRRLEVSLNEYSFDCRRLV